MNKQFVSVPSAMVVYSGKGNDEITVSLFFSNNFCAPQVLFLPSMDLHAPAEWGEAAGRCLSALQPQSGVPGALSGRAEYRHGGTSSCSLERGKSLAPISVGPSHGDAVNTPSSSALKTGL